ncbi:carboxypeptidase-like regulatory domain-containing protein [Paenibacillus piri]|uniref:Carboxypeptidase regulatory-like domain-containing protein n=1 Tax=Paenibacillus piri TaxID=2547395 RepID=A0A4R5KJ91_9BACL|nr:carboxypeptidase-like regulatory domain-containing protein [Paenibacillus piri]TDF94865.1 carboxypeptidase regulatory-like domain-containing protein [Paenibacillus piri]
MRQRRYQAKKFISVFLLFLMSFLTVWQTAFAETNPAASKDIPFPPKNPKTFSAFALPDGQIANEHVQAQIDQTGRFNMGIKEAGSTDHWYNVIYNWPGSPGTSFTTIRVDGVNRVFGNSDDVNSSFVTLPYNLDDMTNEGVWKTGDISVKQVLQTAINPATGIPDAVKIRYTMTNTGTVGHEVGLRMMLDTMVNGNDSAPFRVPTASGIESVNYEKNYIGAQVPSFWQAFEDFNNPDISSQYTMKGKDATAPDRFTIANWGSIRNTDWDYTITENRQTGDSAVGMWWNPAVLSPGETRTITTYYGRPGVGGNQTLVLSGRQRLSYPEWSASPINLIAYLNNNLGSPLANVTLVIVPSSGLSLVDGDATHMIGNLAVGMNAQTTWRVQPNAQGVHQLTVNAYKQGDSVPFANAVYQIEALAPVVPPNVTLGGGRGNQSDGTPVAGRTTPLTVNASFNNPQATGVALVATDGNGDAYHAEMITQNGIDWSLTFTPSLVGLWETPLTIQLTPRYANSQTGPPLHFDIVLIDPSGIVYNAAKGTQNDWPLPGATVILQYHDPELSAWVNMSEDAYPGRLDPVTNPQTTGEDGRYAWNTAAGEYRVVVSRPGFQTATSRSVTVPPPVTDLHVGLTPTDTVAPTLTVNGVANGATYTQPVTVQFNAADDVSGVRTVTYRIDQGDIQRPSGTSGSFTVNAQGPHTVHFTVVDHAGNELTRDIAFTISVPPDTAAPVTTIATSPVAPNGLNGWYKSDVTVSFNAVDPAPGSGVDKTLYRINGGNWTEYAAPFTIIIDGSYTIEYYSKDRAGNAEAGKSFTFKLDKTLPVTKYAFAPINAVTPAGKTYIAGFNITLSATDNLSTVTGTVYRTNGSGWKSYTGPFDIYATTTQTVEYYSTDGAGNQEAPNLMDFIRGIFTGNK